MVKMTKIFSFLPWVAGRNLPVGYEACHGGDQSSKTAEVCSDNQLLHLCRIIGEQHGGGNIADNLARKDTDDPLMVRKDRADENP